MDIKEETNETLNDTYLDGDKLQSSSPTPNQRLNHSDLDRTSVHSPTNLSVADDNTPTASSGSAAFLTQGGSDMSGFQPGFNMNNISATLEALNALRSGQFPSAAAAAAAALQNNFAAAAQQQQHQHQHHQQQQQQQQITEDQTPPAKRQRTSSLSNANGAGSLSTDLDLNENLNNSTTCLTATNVSLNCLNAKTHSIEASSELRAFMEMQNKEHIMRMRILEVQLQAAKYSRDLVEINKTLALQKLQEYASKRLST